MTWAEQHGPGLASRRPCNHVSCSRPCGEGFGKHFIRRPSGGWRFSIICNSPFSTFTKALPQSGLVRLTERRRGTHISISTRASSQGTTREGGEGNHLPGVVSTEEVFLAVLIHKGSSPNLDECLNICSDSQFESDDFWTFTPARCIFHNTGRNACKIRGEPDAGMRAHDGSRMIRGVCSSHSKIRAPAQRYSTNSAAAG